MQAAPPLSGSGTQTDPYLITSKADVLALAKYVNGTDDGTTATNNQTKAGGDVCAGLYFAFTADVDMQHDTTFLGIGAVTNFHRTSTTSWKFSGNIDGRGHKISNLTINGMVFKDDGSISTSSNTTTRGSRQYTGFIGILEKGSVTNLHFDASCSVTSYSKVGMVVGRMSQGSTVSGCSSAGTVRSYSDYAGGIVGDCSATSSTTLTVADCQNTGTVYCNYRYAGGITGGLYYGTITNCINTGRIELHSFHSSRAEGVQEGGGGIMGYWQAGGVITNCFNGGVVSVSNQYAGGITGRSSSSSKVQLRGNVALGYVDCPSMNNRGAVAGNLYSPSIVPENNYYDTSLWGTMAALGTGFVKNANCKPMVAGLDTVSAAKAYAAYFTLSPNDNFKSVNHSFPLGMLEGVVWSATGNLRISDGRCYPAGQGTATLTATCGAFSRTYEFDCKTGISVLDADNDPVVSMRHYLPDGTEVTNPEPGTLIITVSTTASGRRNTTRHIAR